jgi:hypothetical protein
MGRVGIPSWLGILSPRNAASQGSSRRHSTCTYLGHRGRHHLRTQAGSRCPRGGVPQCGRAETSRSPKGCRPIATRPLRALPALTRPTAVGALLEPLETAVPSLRRRPRSPPNKRIHGEAMHRPGAVHTTIICICHLRQREPFCLEIAIRQASFMRRELLISSQRQSMISRPTCLARLLCVGSMRRVFCSPARALSIEYLAPMVWDDVIDIEVCCEEPKSTSFTFLLVGRKASGQVVFRSTFTQVCISPEDKQPTPIPEKLRSALLNGTETWDRVSGGVNLTDTNT